MQSATLMPSSSPARRTRADGIGICHEILRRRVYPLRERAARLRSVDLRAEDDYAVKPRFWLHERAGADDALREHEHRQTHGNADVDYLQESV